MTQGIYIKRRQKCDRIGKVTETRHESNKSILNENLLKYLQLRPELKKPIQILSFCAAVDTRRCSSEKCRTAWQSKIYIGLVYINYAIETSFLIYSPFHSTSVAGYSDCFSSETQSHSTNISKQNVKYNENMIQLCLAPVG